MGQVRHGHPPWPKILRLMRRSLLPGWTSTSASTERWRPPTTRCPATKCEEGCNLNCLSSTLDVISLNYHARNAFSLNQSRRRKMSSYSRQSSTASSVSNAGTSSFLAGRDNNQRQPEMELFNQNRKPRSNYRRPSSLGLATTPLPDKSEAKTKFKVMPASRSHIVAPLKDHLKPEGDIAKTSEVHSMYRNLSPSRPVIHKLKDTL